MLSSLRHPGLDQLSDFLAGEAGPSRPRIVAHLERCAECRDSLQFLRAVTAAAAEEPTEGPAAELRARVLASRANGTRSILPVHDATRRGRHWLSPSVAAVLLALIAGMLFIRRPNEMEAGTTSGTLTFTPAAPQRGQRITASYRPAALLAGQPRLALRARLRSPSGENYNPGVPVITVATLRQTADGAFTASFLLPDSVVYGAFAVEDTAASVIDDDGSRSWELLVSDETGRPLFAALDQRANDMMGRNWEEGYATVQRMVALYPDSLHAWSWLRSFHSWLGRADDDSIRALHHARLLAFDSALTDAKSQSSVDEGLLAWYARGVDSTVAAKWRSRLLRDAPTNSFAIQWRMFAVFDSLHIRHDTARAMRRLDTLWTEAPPDRLAQVASYATDVAFESGDTAFIRLWTTRLMTSERDPRATARRVATDYAGLPSLRAEGIRRLRAELDHAAQPSSTDRALDETLTEQRTRLATTRRRMLATLGRALVADGRSAEARGALSEAASSGWDLGVFRAVRLASLLAGDTSDAITMSARLAVDPRTSAAFADSARMQAERRVGAAEWQRQLDSARALYVQRMLAGASARSLARGTRVRALDGKTQSLRDLTKGRVTIVAFWSRFCGPAIEELPALNRVASRLARAGMSVVSIVDEAKSSPELTAFLREKHVTTPVYLDSWHEASRAFNQWGTPYYYVVDAEGRIRFDVTTSADEALAQAEALRLASTADTTDESARAVSALP